MTSFQVNDNELTAVKGKVAVITGGSSGIGLATTELLLSLGALVVTGDINPPPASISDSLFVQTDVRKWDDLAKLFKAAKEKHGKVDFVFANAGVGPRGDFLSLEVDENGDPKQPNLDTIDINLTSVVNTVTIATHYMKTQSEGAIVIMASSTGLQPLRAIDYSTSKAGAIGFGRSFARLVEVAGLPIRVNTLAPSWTATQVLPNVKDLLAAVQEDCQPASAVAKIATHLMVDKSRHGDLIYVHGGKFTEIEKSILAPAYDKIKGDAISDDAILGKVMALGS
ncbi:levodione reductase [Pyrenophora seminiperda CCB06]|uniref:Levodione reductase n=1 Tax=Pyrenophora seminiperda CCB06 TaxID=1302712 RepID=A0A3M7MFY4_9PLEO|nr:levodione reductase [Pyrenophora seminiperda CCB06]